MMKFKKHLISALIMNIMLIGIMSMNAYADNGQNQQASTGDQGTMQSSNDSTSSSLQLTPVTTNHNQEAGNSLGQRSPNPSLLFSPPNYLQRKAFQDVTRQALPMTPAQVHQFKSMLAATQQAAAADANTPPKPVTSSMMVNLSPGSTPPVINLQKGFITSLVFVDAAGNKWPIESYDLGNPNAFNIQASKGGNTLLVQADTLYTYGNLAVQLKGASTPVMLTLVPGQSTVDYRVDLHVQGQSPNAQPPVGSSEPSPASNRLLDVLNGIPPKDATTLQLSGADCSPDMNNCQGWLSKDGKLFLRIPDTILSPSWLSTMQSSDGVHAYVMEKTPSILVSVHGQPESIKVEGF